MGKGDEVAAAIAGFYAAATGQGGWAVAFDHMLAATGFDGAAFYVVDRATRAPLASRWHRLDESYATEYLAHYVACDPRAAQVFVPEPRRILYDYLHTREEEIDRDPFYAWFQQSQHHRYYLGGQSRAGAALPLTLTLHRPKGRGHVEQAEAEMFAHMLEHFEHAVTLEHSLALDATQAAVRLAEQEAAPHGVVLLDSGLRVLHANAAALRIAARGDAFALSGGGLAALDPASAGALGRMLGDAARGAVTQALRVERRYGGLAYVVAAWPVPGRDLLADGGSVAVAVRIVDPDTQDVDGVMRACAVLGLSAQESAVVRHLVDGADPPEIAILLGLRPATVRTYLVSIFRKTGCRRQGALVGRVMAVARGLGR